MIKHILSIYSDLYDNKKIDLDRFFLEGVTLETRTRESSDPDEFTLGSTNFTKSIEITDPDEFNSCGPTFVTESVENSDVDEFFLQGPTKLTFSQENTDEDEFLPDIQIDSNNKDFDEILLI